MGVLIVHKNQIMMRSDAVCDTTESLLWKILQIDDDVLN